MKKIPVDRDILERTIRFLEDVIADTSRDNEEADKLAKYLQQELNEADGKA